MNKVDFEQLSKIISHALRHKPESYNINIDLEGWVSLSDLVVALKKKGMYVDENIIVEMVEQSHKKRHQILNGKIRAYYGHSVDSKILKFPTVPPEYLYHGTIETNLNSILERGLLPMHRQYVHLSENKNIAEMIAKRKKGKSVILKVIAEKAYINNIQFYKEENGVWLSDSIPPKYIIS